MLLLTVAYSFIIDMPYITVHSRKFGNCMCLLDEDDYEQLSQYRWGLHGRKYIARMVGRKKVFLQREIIKPLPGYVVVTIDGNRMNNTKSNLCVKLLNRNPVIRR